MVPTFFPETDLIFTPRIVENKSINVRNIDLSLTSIIICSMVFLYKHSKFGKTIRDADHIHFVKKDIRPAESRKTTGCLD